MPKKAVSTAPLAGRPPTLLGEVDLHLFGEGSHEALYEHLGAHPMKHEGVDGTWFGVWAPNARDLSVVGDFNSWDPAKSPLEPVGESGIWQGFVPEAHEGHRYKFALLGYRGERLLKIDPFAFRTELPPLTAAVIYKSDYSWQDSGWMSARAGSDPHHQRISIYECHLGSWRFNSEGGQLSYREIAEQLPDYLAEMGFTHVEFLPVSEHPFGGSWGYQVSAYFSPTARFGEPDDLRYLIDRLHQRGIGVILDWVPAHFPRDEFALARFDGTALYEHLDPRQGEHPDWGTLVFNLGRPQVKNFLMSNALYWLDEFHVDGLRVDAVASMLYLDYSRKPGEWVPNKYGGRENLEAVEFIREVNSTVYGKHPGILMIAEESTAWPNVSQPTYLGGLGFGFKWNMGWMNDTLSYFNKPTIYRKFHHNQLTFGLLYAWSEKFLLPLSHDEVVHGKGSLLWKMPGDRWQQLANLRALLSWMWAHPGKQLVFMGTELAQEWEWHHDSQLSWELLDDFYHRGIRDLVKELNRLQLEEPALWMLDHEPRGFEWIDANDSEGNCFTFIRYGGEDARPVACLANLAPIPRPGYRVGLPSAGAWEELFNSDSDRFGGSGTTSGEVFAEAVPWHGRAYSAEVTLPPLGVVWLAPVPAAE